MKNIVIFNIWKVLFFVVFLICVSCQTNKKEQIQNLVKEWNEKEIQFPENLIFTRMVTDTVDFYIPKSKYKIIVYVDSIGCVSCKLQLQKWKEFIQEVDSMCDESVPFLFFFQPKNIRELQYILKHDNFSYPVCIDTRDRFNTLNQFPNQMMLQTFLVDSNNRVKVIGNPVHNLSVKDLYLKELVGSGSQKFPLTKIFTDSVDYHYGTVRKNTRAIKEIILRNTGKEIFRIKGVTTSCDCISAEYEWKEIIPGAEAKIKVTYRAEETGDFWRTITIYGNIPEKSVTLDLWGTVR